MADELYSQLLQKAQGISPLSPLDRTIEDPSGLIPAAGVVEGVGQVSPGLIKTLMNLKAEPLAEAKSLLIRMLLGYRAPEADASAVAGQIPTLMGRRPVSVDGREILSRAVSRIPEAKNKFEYPIRLNMKRPPGAATEYAAEARLRNLSKLPTEVQLEKELLKRQGEVPKVTDYSSLSDVVGNPNAKVSTKSPRPPLSGRWGGGRKRPQS